MRPRIISRGKTGGLAPRGNHPTATPPPGRVVPAPRGQVAVPESGSSRWRMADFPASARAVVVGGGIVGCSTAYHLAKLGWRETIILERHKLTSGSTHHAAGLVGQLRTSA